MARSVLNAPHFQTEEAAFAYVEARLWPTGPVCPHCGCMDRIGRLNGKTTRPGLHKCYDCKKPFTVRIGTIFKSSHLPLHLWLQIIHLMCASKKGISTRQIQRMLQCSMKTAWFLGHRIREAMKDGGAAPIGGGGSTIEVDETFLGKQATVFVSGKGWRTKTGTADMQKIVSLVERGGRARSIHVENLSKGEIVRAMETAARDSHLMTDQAQHYRRIGKDFLSHASVDHGRHEYARGDVTTNTVEGFFSIFKRGMIGVYQHCDAKHLHRYLVEFDFRYSNRIRLGIDDVQRADNALLGAKGKRLTYQTVDSGRAA